jgi:hypothetical protein
MYRKGLRSLELTQTLSGCVELDRESMLNCTDGVQRLRMASDSCFGTRFVFVSEVYDMIHIPAAWSMMSSLELVQTLLQ